MSAEAAQRGDWAWPEPSPDRQPTPVWVDGPRAGHTGRRQHHDATVIDCDHCSVRGVGCGDCVVTVLLGGPPDGVELDPVEERALTVLADAGLVPPLRMADCATHPSNHSVTRSDGVTDVTDVT